jgi:2-polyprenyl-3-methyl-5-hydroxy-6-metoxy-1,4-benzoquinol methylase
MSSNGKLVDLHKGSKCLVCESQTVEQFLDLGHTALANKFLAYDELARPEPAYPLRVGFCHTCSHVQLTEIVPPKNMFEDYLYVSSASDTLKNHLYDLSDIVVERHQLQSQDLVIDIGCNDGTLLSGFRRHGVRVLGVDPAANLAALTRETGIERYVGFFSAATAREIVRRWGTAAVITATNTFPHIPDLRDFVTGLDLALRPGGVFVIEAHYLMDLLDQGAFDTVYHEHVSYWALEPMVYLFSQFGMEVVHAERVPLHHGQLRVFVQRKGEGFVQSSVAALIQQERAFRLNQFSTYQLFAQKTEKIKSDLHAKIHQLRRQGKALAGYGAPAKGNTLLGFLDIGPDLLPYIIDRSPLKQGLYTPGTHIPVVGPDRLLTEPPDYLILLAWNFADEIMAQQAEYRSGGGKFIIPVPEVSIV